MTLVERATVSQLREIGSGLLLQLVEAFSRNAPARVEQVRSGFASGDLELICRSCHSLKSTAATVGAAALTATSRRLEAAAASADVAEIAVLVPTLESQCERTIAELRQLVEGTE